ncbi:helix-turn-helix domain-containing protein [Kibdelosporangium aridum]|uniref:helix-turn-helix domain-containing protein n=1 Tax=Kibdelosporangium aridum TaxID=2030 RepID=UPI0035EBC57E
MDVTVPGTARDGVDILRNEWWTQVGTAIPLPPSTPVGCGDYRIAIEHAKVDDAVIENIYSGSIVGGTGGEFNHLNDRVVVHVVDHGEWRFTGPRERSQTKVPRGRFVVRHNDPSWQFEIGPRTTAKVLILPSAPLRPLFQDPHVTGPSDSAQVRLLMAHARMTEVMLEDLTQAGVHAARSALIELVKGVLTQETDGSEPLLAPALAQAARDLVDSRLAESDLAPGILARELNVSVRTLHRAFAATGQPVMGYIRHKRLEYARQELAVRSVSEVAAHWQFADSSHFIRAFKKEYGQTPTEYIRATRPTRS